MSSGGLEEQITVSNEENPNNRKVLLSTESLEYSVGSKELFNSDLRCKGPMA